MNPDSAITLTVPVFIFASIAVTLAGLLMGVIEIVWLQDVFRSHSLIKKILYKLFVYVLFVIVIMLISFPIATSLEMDVALTDPFIGQKLQQFFFSSTFLSTCVQIGSSISICLLYSAVPEHVGHQVLFDLARGRYHSPKVEDRVFMFLDMRSSTTIAEQLGHVRYFDLLADYYAVMSDAIIDSGAEVYQFIGDEIVITWSVNEYLDFKACVD